MGTRSCRGGNHKTFHRRLCSDPQETHPNGRHCVWKNKRENVRMTKRGGKEEEKNIIEGKSDN